MSECRLNELGNEIRANQLGLRFIVREITIPMISSRIMWGPINMLYTIASVCLEFEERTFQISVRLCNLNCERMDNSLSV